MPKIPGPMNRPHVEHKPTMKFEARVDDFEDDANDRSEAKERAEKKLDMLKSTLKGMTAEKALEIVEQCLSKEMKRCEMSIAEYDDGPSIGDAFDHEDEDE